MGWPRLIGLWPKHDCMFKQDVATWLKKKIYKKIYSVLEENISRVDPIERLKKLEHLFQILSSFVIRLTNVKNRTKNKLRPLPPSLSRFGRSPKK